AGLLMEQASTYGEAVKLGNRFLHLHNNGWTMLLTRLPGGTSLLRLDFHALGKYEPRHFVESLILQFIRLARRYLGAEWHPMSVRFKHKQLSRRAVWQRYLGPNALFEQDVIGVEFSQEELARRVPPREPELRRRLEAMLVDLEAHHNEDLVTRAAELLRALL